MAASLQCLSLHTGNHPFIIGPTGCSSGKLLSMHCFSFAVWASLDTLSAPLPISAAYELTEEDVAVPPPGICVRLAILFTLLRLLDFVMFYEQHMKSGAGYQYAIAATALSSLALCLLFWWSSHEKLSYPRNQLAYAPDLGLISVCLSHAGRLTLPPSVPSKNSFYQHYVRYIGISASECWMAAGSSVPST